MTDQQDAKRLAREASRIAFRMIVNQMDKIAEHVTDPERRWHLLREALNLMRKRPDA